MDYLVEYHAFYVGVRIIRATLRVILLSAVASLIILPACLGYPLLLLAAYLGNRHHNWFAVTRKMLSRDTFQWRGFNFSLFMAATGFATFKALEYAGVGSFTPRSLKDVLTWGTGLLMSMLAVFLYARRTKVSCASRTENTSDNPSTSGNSTHPTYSKDLSTVPDTAKELEVLISRLDSGEDLATIHAVIDYVRINGSTLVSALEDKRRIDFLITAPHPLDVLLYDKVVDANPDASMRFLIDRCQEFVSTQTVYASIEEAEAATKTQG